jgi:hypothetical protein
MWASRVKFQRAIEKALCPSKQSQPHLLGCPLSTRNTSVANYVSRAGESANASIAIVSNNADRVLSYDSITALILLQDEDTALLVDVSLCVDPKGSRKWIQERKGVITVIGYLEHSSVRHAN